VLEASPTEALPYAAESWAQLLCFVGWPEPWWIQLLWLVALLVVLLAIPAPYGPYREWLFGLTAEADELQKAPTGPGLRSYWRVPAGLLPSMIPLVVSNWPQDSSPRSWAPTIVLLLVATAALNTYGQARDNGERIKTAAERAKQTDLIAEQTNLIINLLSEIEKQI
jgi:hypothetical protein